MMKTDQAKKVIIKVDSDVQQENVKNTRKGLKTLQPAAVDKENLAGRPHILKESKFAFENEAKKQKPPLMHKETQTEKYITNIDDITGEEASIDYWKRLAEKRQESLDDSLLENEKLKDENETLKGNIGTLQEENKVLKEMLEESRNLVEVLQEMIDEGENEDPPKEESESLEKEGSEDNSN